MPLAGGAYLADAKRPLAFDAPDGYLFTVRKGADALMRRAGARPVFPEIGVWHVDRRTGPALRERLLARDLLHDTAVDRKRLSRASPAPTPSPRRSGGRTTSTPRASTCRRRASAC